MVLSPLLIAGMLRSSSSRSKGLALLGGTLAAAVLIPLLVTSAINATRTAVDPHHRPGDRRG